MNTKSFTTRLMYPLFLFAFIGLYGCSQDMESEPTSALDRDSVSDTQGATASDARYRSNHYIVLSTDEKLPDGLDKQLVAAKGKISRLHPEVGVASVYSEDPAFIANASKIPGVRSVVRDMTIQWINPVTHKKVALEQYSTPPFSGDDDFFFDLQWGHAAIKAPAAWNAGARGKGVRVAVLDTGFDLSHPDLAPNIDMAASKNFVLGEELQYNLTDVYSHGTHVAGTIAALDNGYGTIGVAPEAELILIKVLSDDGPGAFSWVLAGILHATNAGADVINMSLGAYILRNGKYRDEEGNLVNGDTKGIQELLVALSRVTRYATNMGVTVIAAAGNAANNGNADKSLLHVPSSSSGVLSISATAPLGWATALHNPYFDHLASYSNYGTPDVHFAAPGGDFMYPGDEEGSVGGWLAPVWAFDLIFSTGNLNSYYWSAGTSMASPHAAGVAALIIGKNGGKMSPAQVVAKLRATSDDLGKSGRDPVYGYGRVNAYRAVTE